MTYDNWKTTAPDDRFLGLPEDEQQLSEEAQAIIDREMAMHSIEMAIRDLERTSGLATAGDLAELADYSRTLGLLAMDRK